MQCFNSYLDQVFVCENSRHRWLWRKYATYLHLREYHFGSDIMSNYSSYLILIMHWNISFMESYSASRKWLILFMHLYVSLRSGVARFISIHWHVSNLTIVVKSTVFYITHPSRIWGMLMNLICWKLKYMNIIKRNQNTTVTILHNYVDEITSVVNKCSGIRCVYVRVCVEWLACHMSFTTK